MVSQEEKVSEAFSRQSNVFDEADSGNKILQWMRSRVRQHVLDIWKPGEHILELNAGTGLDALFFAEKGFHIHATDNASGMLAVLGNKINDLNLSKRITIQQCSFLELGKISENKFDHIFSNFGGLNCTDKLDTVIRSFSNLLKPNGTITLVLMPPVCPWEILFLLKGNTKLAFRRFKKDGAPSHLEGVNFTTWYYSPLSVKKMLGKEYEILSVKGLGIIVPPPFMESFPRKHPGLYRSLTTIENAIAGISPFRAWADHFIISTRKVS